MPRKKPTAIVPLEQIETRIHIIRGVRVMLDDDIAELYEVPTKRLNVSKSSRDPRNGSRTILRFSLPRRVYELEVANCDFKFGLRRASH